MVYLVAVEHRVLVYYCAALLPEVDLRMQTQSLCKECLGPKCKACLEVFDA